MPPPRERDEEPDAPQRDEAESALDAVVEEYFGRLRRGEPADAEAFARRVPGREREFRELVGTLRALEVAGTPEPAAAREGEPPLQRIGRFQLLRQLGRGGMGVVHEALDDTLDRNVALKLLPGHATLDEREVARFQREAHAAARLSHPHVVPIFGVGCDDGTHWMAMQLIRGESVEQLLRRARERGARPLPVAEVVRHAIAVADALSAAHEEGILHRDVKPSNLLLDDHDEIWVTDFGLAKSEGSATLTRTGETVGTPRYMAPEAFAGWADPRSDVWSLGATLYELLAGRPAFDGANRAQLLKQIADVEPPPLRRLDPEIPRDLATIVHKCLQKESYARYPSARALADDLRRFAAGEPILAQPPSLAYRAGLVVRRHPTATMLLVVALAGGITMTLLEARRARGSEVREHERFDDVRHLAESFLFEFHDAIANLPGSTKARELVVKRALEYLDRLAAASSDDSSLRRELATAYQKVGDVQGNPYQSNLGDLAGARKSYATAIGLIEPSVEAGKASDEDRSVLAAAELGGGGLAVAAGDTASALDMSGNGLALREWLAAAHPDATHRRELATAYQYHAYNLSASNRLDEALAALARQKSLLQELLAADPSDVVLRRSTGQNRYLAAYALKKKEDFDGALVAFAAAIDVQRSLLQEDSANTLFRRDLIWTLNDLGTFATARHDATKALETFSQTVPLCEEAVAADPKNLDARTSLAVAHTNAGNTLTNLGRTEEALEHLDEAVSECEALVRDDPTSAYVRKLLANAHAEVARAHYLGNRSDPDEISVACDEYRRAVAIFEELKSKGRLAATYVSSYENAKVSLAECEAALAAVKPKESAQH